VVLSHAPELIDGNRSRELLTRAFGTLSFGEMGVDGGLLIRSQVSFETITVFAKVEAAHTVLIVV